MQALIFCFEAQTFGFDICMMSPSYGWGVGQLDRSVLREYCSSEMTSAISTTCPLREHDTCCTCFADTMPVGADNGHCCADCNNICDASISELAHEDDCYGVPSTPCSPVGLVK